MRFVPLLICAIALPGAVPASTLYETGPLRFATQNAQSMWGPGNATRFEGTERLTVGLGGSTGRIGGVTGELVRETVPTNPEWFLWKTCKETINFACGGEPDRRNRTVTVLDTRIGAEISAESRGEIGAEVSYLFDGGSVRAEVEHIARAVLPTAVRVGETFRLNPQAEWTDGSLSAQSPTAGASVGTYLDMELSVSGRGCAPGFGCDGFSDEKILDTGVRRQEIVDIDPNRVRYLDGFLPGQTFETGLADQTAELSVGLSGSVPVVKIEVESTDADGRRTKTELSSGIDLSISTQVASAGIRFPEDSGQARLSGGAVDLALRSDFLDVKADVDGLVPVIPAGGLDIDVGPFSLGLTAYDVDIGPTLDVFQDLSLTSALFVDLGFDRLVEIEGVGLVDRWSGFWSDLPGMKVFERTVFSPLWSVVSQLTNRSGVALGFELTAELFKLSASAALGPFTLFDEELGPLVRRTVPLAEDFRTVSFFDRDFRLGGFNTVAGAAFVIDPTTGQVIETELAPVPLPAGVLLLLSGLGAMAVLRRRRVA